MIRLERLARSGFEPPSQWLGKLLLIGLALAASGSDGWAQSAPAPASVRESATVHHGGHGAEDHQALFELVREGDVTHTAVRSGAWSEPVTWDQGRLPSADARVSIPQGVAVEIDEALDSGPIDWLRVDGRLSFRRDVDTRLTVRTLAVLDQGQLEIGSAGAPIAGDVTAKLVFAPRRGAVKDPFDLGGGLISTGAVEMAGERKTAHRGIRTPVRRGLQVLRFGRPPMGWRVGDRVLIPGIGEISDEDEQRTIVEISKQGRVVHLDRPLDHDHLAPAGVALVIGNLTRNIELRSLETAPRKARGHVMIMPSQTAARIDSVAFLGLGRTDVQSAPTVPEIGPDGEVVPGSDANTIARYPLHFHVLSGGDAHRPPHVVRHSVVVDSPKFGIVNHGGHVVAEDNVTLNIDGSHFVAENGSEVGSFRRNMAVRSVGSGDCQISRQAMLDFAHEGFGFWLQSSAVEVTGNWASGHAQAGISLFQQKAVIGNRPQANAHGQVRRLDPKMLIDPPPADDDGQVRAAHLNAYYAGNTIAAAHAGIELWHHKLNARHREWSVIEGTTIWHCETGVALMYSKNVALRNSKILGPGSYGVFANPITRNLLIDGGSIEGLGIGVHMSQRGRNLVRNLVVDSDHIDLEISTAALPGREIYIDNVDLRSKHYTIAMREWVSSTMGDLALAYSTDRIQLSDRYGRAHRLFFPLQSPDAVPFVEGGPEELRGLTSSQIESRFGIARGGELAPADAVGLPRSNALAVRLPSVPVAAEEALDPFSPALNHFRRSAEPGQAGDWVVEKENGAKPGAMVFADKEPPIFLLRTSLNPLQIHPDDVPYGLQIGGMVADRVGNRVTLLPIKREFSDLRVGPDGTVRVGFEIQDAAGNRTPVELAARVTEDAVRRGPNLSYYLQQPTCGDCERADIYRAAAWRSFGIQNPEDEVPFFAAVPPLPDACVGSDGSRVELAGPFRKEGRYAYVVPRLRAFRKQSDNLLSKFRSTAVLCEDGIAIGVGHDPHDDIRQKGRGRFSHWTGSLYFSSSDNSDPNVNGRQYALVFRQTASEDS